MPGCRGRGRVREVGVGRGTAGPPPAAGCCRALAGRGGGWRARRAARRSCCRPHRVPAGAVGAARVDRPAVNNAYCCSCTGNSNTTSWPVSFLYTPEKVSVLYSAGGAGRAGMCVVTQAGRSGSPKSTDQKAGQQCRLCAATIQRGASPGRPTNSTGSAGRQADAGGHWGAAAPRGCCSPRGAAEPWKCCGLMGGYAAGGARGCCCHRGARGCCSPAELRSLGSSSTLSTLEPSSLQRYRGSGGGTQGSGQARERMNLGRPGRLAWPRVRGTSVQRLQHHTPHAR